MSQKTDLIATLGVESLTKLLLGNNEFCIFKLSKNGDILTNEISYVYNDLAKFDLVNYKNLKELLFYVDLKSEVPEIVGIKKFVAEIKDRFLNAKNEIEDFYLPLKYGDKHCYFEATLIGKDDDIYVLLKQSINEPNRYENLYASSYKDSLSGLFNYNCFNIHIQDISGVHYFGFFDVDRFKTINDTLSHAVGDDVIYRIGLALINMADDNVIFYRRSGDEFLFVTNDLGLEETKELIEKINQKIRKIDVHGFDITISLGFTKYEKGIGYSVDSAVSGADLGMYRSKLEGKGRSIYISPEEIIEIEKTSSIIDEVEKASKLRKI